MTTAAAIALPMEDHEEPGHHVSPGDELRAFTLIVQRLETMGPNIAKHISSPSHAAYFVQLIERAHHATDYALFAAADTARRTLAHELPAATLNQINDFLNDPAEFVAGRCELPAAPVTPPTGRSTFKDTIEFLQNTMHIGFFEARERVHSAARLFPHTDIHGIKQPAQFPLLGQALVDGKVSPKELANAARKLERMQPDIKAYPNAAELATELEAKIAESVTHDDPRTTNQLFSAIQVSLENGVKEPSEEVIRSKVGMTYRGTNAGIAEFLLRTRAADAEILLALCAQMDNPRMKAGDRDALLQQADIGPDAANESQDAAAEDTNCTQPGTASSLTDFPDFLIDPATGRPLTDPAEVNKLTLDPVPSEANILEAMNNTGYGADGLTPPQRHLQGLMNLIKTNGRPTKGTKTAGLPSPEIFIVTTLAELEGRAAQSGLTLHGQKYTPAELRHALCIGGAIPITMNGASQILDLGTEQRYFPDYMRKAILAIYGGCIFPNCTVPPEHCEIDHDNEWAKGGTTRINDGRPVCSGHHHARHTGQIRIVRDTDGLFSVILPKFMDPEQKPRRNTYWRQPPITPPLF